MSALGIATLRLVGAQGTNKIMDGELARLARRTLPGVTVPAPRKVGLGSLVYPFSLELARTAVCYHRTCARVLADLFTSTATRLEPLYDDLRAQMTAHPGGWYRAGARLSVAHRVTLTLDARRSELQFADGVLFEGVPLSQTMNSTTSTVDGAVEIHLTPLTTVSLVTSVQQDRFDESPGRDSDTFRVMPTIRPQTAPRRIAKPARATMRPRMRWIQPQPVVSRLYV